MQRKGIASNATDNSDTIDNNNTSDNIYANNVSDIIAATDGIDTSDTTDAIDATPGTDTSVTIAATNSSGTIDANTSGTIDGTHVTIDDARLVLQEYYGENVLHMGCVAEDASLVKWLLDIGSDIHRCTLISLFLSASGGFLVWYQSVLRKYC